MWKVREGPKVRLAWTARSSDVTSRLKVRTCRAALRFLHALLYEVAT